jgi:hypothetical protein
MLDPFSALAVATAATQFLDFGTKLIRGSLELYGSVNGALSRNVIIEGLNKELRDASEDVSTKLQKLQREERRDLTQNERAVQSLAQDCVELSKELGGILEQLKVKEGTPKAVKAVESWQKSRAALRQKSRIQDIEKRLGKKQQLLQTRFLAMLRSVIVRH